MKRRRNGFRNRRTVTIGLICGGLLFSLYQWGCVEKKEPGASLRPGNIHGIWVTRFDYRTRDDVQRIIRDCAAVGFNTVFFQVRGNGTAFYNSHLEPWAEELGGRNPGFDPLAVACGEAHRNGIALHAYVNAIPGWRGKKPPRDPNQLYNKHPEWFWYDQQGRRQPLQSFYVGLNPCLPEVRRYITAVCHDIVSRYDVDGLHLDYIRFPNEAPASGPPGADYPRDRRTVELFRRETHRDPDRDREVWTRWRADQITKLVGEIRQMIRSTKPAVALSAAVGSDPQSHYRTHFQDSLRWLRQGLVDFVVPMNYTSDDQQFARRNQFFLDNGGRGRLVPGMIVERPGLSGRGVIDHTRRQIETSVRQAGGYCVFAYSFLFDRPCESPTAAASRERAERRRALVPFLRSIGDPSGARYASAGR